MIKEEIAVSLVWTGVQRFLCLYKIRKQRLLSSCCFLDRAGHIWYYYDRDSIRSLSNVRKPIFKVVFEDFGDQTGIRTQFMNPGLITKLPDVSVKDIDRFWEIKLDAERIRLEQEKAWDGKGLPGWLFRQ